MDVLLFNSIWISCNVGFCVFFNLGFSLGNCFNLGFDSGKLDSRTLESRKLNA